MPEPTDVLVGLRASTADLIQELTESRLTDDDVSAATLLPGWTRGHLLTHLARNADGVAGTLSGALRGEVVAQYPGGSAQRESAIEDGAARPMATLVADVRDSASRLDRVIGAVDEAESWDRPTGDERAAHEWLLWRWLEVEVHRVDLDHGYRPDRWPPLFVALVLDLLAGSVETRAAQPVRVRVDADDVAAGDAAGREWHSSGDASADATEVRGPGWAVLAWLLGRPSAGGDALSAMPELAPWR